MFVVLLLSPVQVLSSGFCILIYCKQRSDACLWNVALFDAHKFEFIKSKESCLLLWALFCTKPVKLIGDENIQNFNAVHLLFV